MKYVYRIIVSIMWLPCLLFCMYILTIPLFIFTGKFDSGLELMVNLEAWSKKFTK